MDQHYDQKMIQVVFEKLGVSQQHFMQTMQTYGQNPQTGPQMQQVLQQTRGMPAPPPEGSPEAELLSKERILEIVKI